MKPGRAPEGGPPLAMPPASRPAVPAGWECPVCRHVYAPWVACCAACPADDGSRREITEN